MLKEYERFPNWLVDVEEGKIWSKKLKRYIGTIDKKGYVHVKPPKGYKHAGFHQYIWMCVNGDIPNGYDIHHIDHNPSNNSIYNLEIVERHVHRSEHKQNISDETKKKISEANKGKHHTEDTKRKISEHKKGTIFTEEHRRKISNAHINNPKLSKQVAQYTLEGELVKIWNSTMECCRNGFNQGHIASCCRGERKKHKKFKWKYYNET